MAQPPFVPLPPAPGQAPRASALPTTTLPPIAPPPAPAAPPPFATPIPQRVIWIPREGWPADLSHLNPERPIVWVRDGNEFDTQDEADAAYAVADGNTTDESGDDGRDEEPVDDVTPEEKAHLEDEVVTPEDAETPAPPVPETLIPPEKPLIDASIPERTARRAPRGAAAKAARAAREAEDKPVSPVRQLAETALAEAEAGLASAYERHEKSIEAMRAAEQESEDAYRALAFAKAVADHAHAHPALQES